jgi:hypothetical protein
MNNIREITYGIAFIIFTIILCTAVPTPIRAFMLIPTVIVGLCALVFLFLIYWKGAEKTKVMMAIWLCAQFVILAIELSFSTTIEKSMSYADTELTLALTSGILAFPLSYILEYAHLLLYGGSFSSMVARVHEVGGASLFILNLWFVYTIGGIIQWLVIVPRIIKLIRGEKAAAKSRI